METSQLQVFVNSLVSGAGSNQVWGEIVKVAPFVITVFVVAVGYRILRRVIGKGSKLKAGI